MCDTIDNKNCIENYETNNIDSNKIRENYLKLVNNKSNTELDIRTAMVDVGKIAIDQINSLSSVSDKFKLLTVSMIMYQKLKLVLLKKLKA